MPWSHLEVVRHLATIHTTQSLILELRLANMGEKPRIALNYGDKPVNDLVLPTWMAKRDRNLLLHRMGEKSQSTESTIKRRRILPKRLA